MCARRLAISLIVIAALVVAACAEPPNSEIQQARAAIDAAKAADADQYAREEFAAAQDALKRAGEAVEQRDYRLALNNALDARERAQTAAKQAVDAKAAAKTDAQRAMARATAALDEGRVRLKNAEAAHVAPRTLAKAHRTVTGVEHAVQKARTALDGGDYLAVIAALDGTTTRLREMAQELEPPSPPHRRR